MMNLALKIWTIRNDWAALLFLGASLALNVRLGWQLRDSPHFEPVPFGVGTVIDPLPVRDISGAVTTITWNGGAAPSIVYVFSPSCQWCARNVANIKTMYSSLNKTFRFVGLSITSDGLPDYIRDQSVPFPSYTVADDLNARRFAASGTPQTLLVRSDGRIEAAWLGAYSVNVQRQIEAKLNIHLPGLLPEPTASAAQ
jgi:hypothetical protein